MKLKGKIGTTISDRGHTKKEEHGKLGGEALEAE
jgi:hypothetical protein